MKFLIADDSATMRRIIVDCLDRTAQGEGNEYVYAGNGRDALEQFNETIEFIITDCNMPVMNGIELIRQLRANPDGKTVPILMVTTRSATEDIALSSEVGANGNVMKPFTPRILRDRIDDILLSLPHR